MNCRQSCYLKRTNNVRPIPYASNESTTRSPFFLFVKLSKSIALKSSFVTKNKNYFTLNTFQSKVKFMMFVLNLSTDCLFRCLSLLYSSTHVLRKSSEELLSRDHVYAKYIQIAYGNYYTVISKKVIWQVKSVIKHFTQFCSPSVFALPQSKPSCCKSSILSRISVPYSGSDDTSVLPFCCCLDSFTSNSKAYGDHHKMYF